MRPSVSGFVLCAVLATFEATAERAPDPGSKDDRIKTIAYSPNDVIAVQGHFGFSTLIEFAAEETVETVSIGDSEAWQVVKPSQPNLLFVKPIDLVGDTNMTVISNKRVLCLYAQSGSSSFRSRSVADLPCPVHLSR